MKLLLAVLPTILLTSYSQLVIKWRVATLAATSAQSMSVSERTFAYLVDPFIISAYAFSLLSSVAWFFVVRETPCFDSVPCLCRSAVLDCDGWQRAMAEGDYLDSASCRLGAHPCRRRRRQSSGVIVDAFLAPVRQHLDAQAPHLRPLFDVMAGEARFARWWLDDDLRRLPEAASILEVGGGAFLLTYELAREGFAITAIEPTGVGFGAFEELGEMVLALAARDGVVPKVVRCKAEEFRSDARFQFAFSVNVMEHIEAPNVAIERVSASLSPGGSYRFLCPNYLFPYEPHFNIPTFGSKALTERLLRRRIQADTRTDDPIGLWKSLNWITVPQVRRMAAADASLAIAFQRRTLASMIERAVGDVEFAKRRAPWMVTAIKVLRATRLLRFASLVPATCQPLMDVRLTKLY